MPEKKEKVVKPVKVEMPEQNGIKMPRPGTQCAQIWEMADSMSKALKAPVSIDELNDKALAAEFNPATIKTQYARWRKFHGVEGRIESPKAKAKREEVQKAKAQKAADREAAKVKREQEKEAKAKKAAEDKAAKEAEKKTKAEAAAKAKAEKAAQKQAK